MSHELKYVNDCWIYRDYKIHNNFIHRPDPFYIEHNGQKKYFETVDEAKTFIDELYQ